MSETELWKGSIKKIDVPEVRIEDQIKHLEAAGFYLEYDFDEGELHTYRDSEVHYNNDNKTFWDRRNLKLTEAGCDDVQDYSVNGENVNIVCQFYNGGTCISEQLDEITSKDLFSNNETKKQVTGNVECVTTEKEFLIKIREGNNLICDFGLNYDQAVQLHSNLHKWLTE